MYRRIWEIRDGGYGRRHDAEEEAYKEGYERGCDEGYEKAMREMRGGYGMRDRGYDRDHDYDYDERRRRDSRGRFM